MKLKKLIVLILCASVLVGGIAGCSETPKPETTAQANEESENKEGEEHNAEEENTEERGKRTIIDHTGVEVEIPADIDRVVISSIMPLPSVYAFFRGSVDGLAGIHPMSMSAAKNSYLATVYPAIGDIDTTFVENGEINIEQLMALKPDVVFYSAANTAEREMYDNAGIKAIGFSTTMSDFNSIETFANWIDLLGQIYGEADKANEIIEYGRSVEREILSKTSSIANEERPKVLILFKYGNGKIVTSGNNFFGQYWIEAAGGINVAQSLTGQAEINMEQIYEWNPDMIFITNFSNVLPEDLYGNVIEGNDWSKVKAVQEQKVYKFPLGMYRWFPPSSDTPLSLMWLAKKMQPEIFEHIDMDKEMKDYYKNYYNVELSDGDVEAIYNPVREAAGQ